MTAHTPLIALIIPTTRTEPLDTARLLAGQTLQPSAVVVVAGVAPNGRARNHGVARLAQLEQAGTVPVADWLLFVDDDAQFGHLDCIERLYRSVQTPGVAIAGAARILPADASPFERAVAAQVARIENPIVPTDTVTTPDPPHYQCSITTTCCLVSRAVFEHVGGFDDTLTRGVDSDFFIRVRRLHSDQNPVVFVQSGGAWVTHHAPATLGELWRKHVAYGAGHAQAVRRVPARGRAGNVFVTPLHALVWFVVRTLWIPVHCFVPWSFGDPRWRIAWSPLKAFASYASACGYLIGWYRHAD